MNVNSIKPISLRFQDISTFENASNYQDGILLGAYKEGTIYIKNINSSERYTNSTLPCSNILTTAIIYHEIFHAIFRSFINETYRNRLLRTARIRYGSPNLNDLYHLAILHNINFKNAYNLSYEELLANDFMLFAIKKHYNINPLSKFSRDSFESQTSPFFNFYRFLSKYKFHPKYFSYQNLKENIFEESSLAKRDPNDDIYNFFCDIIEGKYRDAEIQPDNKKGEAFAYLKLEDDIIANSRDKIVNITKYLDNSTSDAIISSVAIDVVNNYGANAKEKDIYDAIEKFSFRLAKMLYDENAQEILGNTLSREGVRIYVDKLDSIIDALVDPDNIEIIKDEVKEKLSFINTVSSIDEENEELELEEGERGIVKKDATQVGGFKSASKRMRHYISLTTVQRNIFGLPNTEWEKLLDAAGDDINFTFAVDASNIYNNLIKDYLLFQKEN